MNHSTIWILVVLVLATYLQQSEAGFFDTLKDVGLYSLNTTLQVADVATKAAKVAMTARG